MKPKTGMLNLFEDGFINNTKNYIYRIKNYLIFLIIAIIPFWRMGFSGYWNKTDIDYPYEPARYFHDSLYLWNDFSLGHSTIIGHSLENLDIAFLLTILDSIGIPTGIGQRLYLVSLFFLMGWGMYYLVKTMAPFPSKKLNETAGIFSAIFYQINPYVIYRLQNGAPAYIEAMAFLPFAVAFLYIGSSKCAGGIRKTFKYAFLWGISSIFIFSAHPGIMVMLIVFFSIYFSILILGSKDYIHKIKFAILSILLAISFNGWWFFPRVYTYFFTSNIELESRFSSSVVSMINYPNFVDIWKDVTETTLPLRVLYDQPLGTRFAGNLPYPIFSPDYWMTWLNGFFFIFVGILFVAIVWSCFLHTKVDRKLIGFGIISAISVGLAMGGNSLPGTIFFWVFTHVKVFLPLYEPSRFFQLITFGYAYLFGVSAILISSYLTIKFSKRVSTIFYISLILLIFIHSFPILTGNLSGNLEPMNVPDYFREGDDWLDSHEGNFRVLYLPKVNWLKRYSWAPVYDMVGIEKNVFSGPLIMTRVAGGPEPETSQIAKKFLYYSILERKGNDLGEILNLFNIKYIIVGDDRIDEANVPITNNKIPTAYIKKYLNKSNDMQLVQIFGNLSFYENLKYSENQIYLSSNLMTLPEYLFSPPHYGLQTYYSLFNDSRYSANWDLLFLSEGMNFQYIKDEYKSIAISNYDLKVVEPDIFSRNMFNSKWTQGQFSKNKLYWVGNQLVTDGFSSNLLVTTFGGVVWTDYNSRAEVDVRAITTFSEGGSQATLRTNIQNKDDYYSIKISDENGNGKWDHFKIIQIKDGAEIHGVGWQPLSQEIEVAHLVSVYNDGSLFGSVFDNPGDEVGSTSIDVDRLRGGSVALGTINSKVSWKNLTLIDMKIDYPDTINKNNNTVEYIKINPTKYYLKIHAESPFILVFSSSFDNDWRLYDGGPSILRNLLFSRTMDARHFLVNGYANGWYIDKTGDYGLTLYYWPQVILDAGLIIFIVTFCGSLVYLYHLRRDIR